MSDQHQSRFADRHIGPDASAVSTMLDVIGVASLDELAAKALPAGILDALSAGGVAPGRSPHGQCVSFGVGGSPSARCRRTKCYQPRSERIKLSTAGGIGSVLQGFVINRERGI